MERLETAYLKIFKVVILIVLTLALFASIGLLLKGWGDLNTKAAEPPAAKQPKVGVEDFLKTLKDQPAPQDKPDGEPQKKASPAADKAAQEKQMRDMAARHAKLAAEHYKACREDLNLNQDAFATKRVQWLLQTLRDNTQGEPAVTQFDSFYSTLVAHPDSVAWCKLNVQAILQGKTGIPDATVNFFDKTWEKQHNDEQAKLRKFNRDELARVASAQARATMELYAAGAAFLTFMLLSLILIFARIETNLRGNSAQGQ